MKRLREAACSFSPYSRHGDQVFRRSGRDGGDAAEMIEQRTRGNERDSRRRCQQQLGRRPGVPALSATIQTRTPRGARVPLLPRSESVQPERRILGVGASKNRNAVLDRGEYRSPNCVRAQWAVIEVGPFDEEEWRSARAAETPKLRPKPALEHGEMKVEDEFALDHAVGAHGVVPDPPRLDGHLGAQHRERIQNAASPFVNVRDNVDRRSAVLHHRTVPAAFQQGVNSFLAKARKL